MSNLKRNMYLSQFLLAAWMVWGSEAGYCPYLGDAGSFCNCQQFQKFAIMSCSNITNAEDLDLPIKATVKTEILALNIANSSLLYIPHDIFNNTKFSKIRLENTQLMALSDTDLAFQGLEDHLEEIRAVGSFYITTWDWSQLRNLKYLDLIEIHNIGMRSLDKEFPNLKTLTTLGLIGVDLEFIHPRAFTQLPELRLLVLNENHITEMRRSMFPTPAEKLNHLDLSNNLLSTLPDDMFIEMPVLSEVLLKNNKFISLNEETFSIIFSKLQQLTLSGNKIRCDCQLKWLVKHRIPFYFDGKCDEPENLEGESLRFLPYNELHCSQSPEEISA